MAHPFEVRKEIEVEATPEEVWEAIATGPGLDAWFMGRNEVEPGEGGKVRMTLPAWTLESSVTVWDPPRRFVTDTGKDEDGRLMVFEYLIEGRDGGSTVLRFVHSGFLAGDDWETEYEALKSGDPMYIHKLAQYLKYFRGRTATPVDVYGPQVPDREQAWVTFRTGLGLPGAVAEGDQVRLTPEGLPPMDGVVDWVSPETLGVRTSDGLYRFIHGLGGTVVLGHHIFADVDQQATEQAWQAWVDRAFA
ncbi:MAG TPA: SRPBCC domain-containing protein [Actinomycetota bacterium]|jgi:uncharacterized protein YndB with AHSA1/START domain